ncbi:hypothetical protein CEXT_491001 [Caerostris extrusa]|uniref:Uncharacterized protein n=1 Tax=Caerostris extrusa TaxID=172846 RepID=A0AAV4XL63_CAEEX|nr:hypothetical protein CEXT_491001 [Caerostris extrusa]
MQIFKSILFYSGSQTTREADQIFCSASPFENSRLGELGDGKPFTFLAKVVLAQTPVKSNSKKPSPSFLVGPSISLGNESSDRHADFKRNLFYSGSQTTSEADQIFRSASPFENSRLGELGDGKPFTFLAKVVLAQTPIKSNSKKNPYH